LYATNFRADRRNVSLNVIDVFKICTLLERLHVHFYYMYFEFTYSDIWDFKRVLFTIKPNQTSLLDIQLLEPFLSPIVDLSFNGMRFLFQTLHPRECWIDLNEVQYAAASVSFCKQTIEADVLSVSWYQTLFMVVVYVILHTLLKITT